MSQFGCGRSDMIMGDEAINLYNSKMIKNIIAKPIRTQLPEFSV